MAYTTIDDPSQHFDILTRSGVYDSSGTYDLTGLNFQPDFVWEKVRSVSGDHYLQNSSLTGKKMLKSNSSADENTDGNIESYLSNGIQINRQYDWNSSRTLVDWFWKANGGTTSSNTDGSITSTVQANTTAGFSILTYSANATAGATVGHGLGTTPSVVILKKRSGTGDGNWMVGHKAYVGNAAENVALDGTGVPVAADDTAGSTWNRTAFTSTVFTLGDGQAGDWTGRTNRSGYTMVAYCFAEIKGYSKFGSYTGNGSTDGVFIYTGFKPAWVMFKRSSAAENWFIQDTTRGTFNVVNKTLFANLSDSEYTNTNYNVDHLSNGFKLRTTDNHVNASGNTYIYMAFAEHPFVSSKGVPVTAR